MLPGIFKGKPTRLSTKWEQEPVSVSCRWEKTQQPIFNESPLLCEVGSGNPSTCICCYLSAFSWMTFSSGLQINKGWLGVLTALLKAHINLKDLDDSYFHSDCSKQTFLTPQRSEADIMLMCKFGMCDGWIFRFWILLWLTYKNEESNHLVLMQKIWIRI